MSKRATQGSFLGIKQYPVMHEKCEVGLSIIRQVCDDNLSRFNFAAVTPLIVQILLKNLPKYSAVQMCVLFRDNLYDMVLSIYGN